MDGISTSLSGVNVAGASMALSANNLANLNTNGYQAQTLQQTALPQGGVTASGVQTNNQPTVPGGSNVDIATEAVNLNVQGLSTQANLVFIKEQQKMLGSALDMLG